MSGEKDLSKLLAQIQPVLLPEVYVFATVEVDEYFFKHAKMIFHEEEATTVIIAKDKLPKDHPFTFECKQITLQVHSSLEAVGFLSAISKLLTENKIASNCVAGYYHDHLFIKNGQESTVMKLLTSFSCPE